MKGEKKIIIDGHEWDLKVTRNMSFWHQWISSYGHYHHMKDFGVNSSMIQLAITFNGTQTHVFTYEPNYSEYNQAFLQAVSNKRKFLNLKKKYHQYAKSLINSLAKCNQQLNIKNWRRFVKEYTRYCPGLYITVSVGRIVGKLLAYKLKEIGMPPAEIPATIAIISYPKEHTPLFLSQLDLLKIGVRIQKEKISRPQQGKLLIIWHKKYRHIPINFCDEPWTMADARAQLKAVMAKNCAAEILSLEQEHKAKLKNARAKLQEISNQEINLLAYTIAVGTIINEFRKGIFSKISLGYRDIFRRVAKKAGSNNWRDCFYLRAEEMEKIIGGDRIDITELVSQRKIVACIATSKGKMEFLNKNDTKKLISYIDSILGKVKEKIEATDITKGFGASKGIVKGMVKIILGVKDFNKLQPGDILVTTMTSVDFVPVMKRAAAFITNEGGITSHASIVAREMNKPCIIGTKIATKIFKDGDLVEVDANKGIVKKLSK